MASEVMEGFARNLAANARSQVEKAWGENADKRLGGTLYKALLAQSAFLALVSHTLHGGLSDAEVRQLVSLVWFETTE